MFQGGRAPRPPPVGAPLRIIISKLHVLCFSGLRSLFPIVAIIGTWKLAIVMIVMNWRLSQYSGALVPGQA